MAAPFDGVQRQLAVAADGGAGEDGPAAERSLDGRLAWQGGPRHVAHGRQVHDRAVAGARACAGGGGAGRRRGAGRRGGGARVAAAGPGPARRRARAPGGDEEGERALRGAGAAERARPTEPASRRYLETHLDFTAMK